MQQLPAKNRTSARFCAGVTSSSTTTTKETRRQGVQETACAWQMGRRCTTPLLFQSNHSAEEHPHTYIGYETSQQELVLRGARTKRSRSRSRSRGSSTSMYTEGRAGKRRFLRLTTGRRNQHPPPRPSQDASGESRDTKTPFFFFSQPRGDLKCRKENKQLLKISRLDSIDRSIDRSTPGRVE